MTTPEPELSKTIQDMLPELIANDPTIRDFVLRTVSNYYASREETESRFDQVLAEIQRDREEQSRLWREQREENQAILARLDQAQEESNRRWEDNTRQWEDNTRQWAESNRQWAESNRRWEDNTRQWAENNRQWHEQHQHNQALLAELKRHDRRYESTIGALGSRWGLYSEASFRNALNGILTDSFGVQVLNLTLYDPEGEVFGRPDQVELDLIIQNGMTIACEIKSSIDKAGMYSFGRKVDFYAKHAQREISRKIVISPMVDDRARPVAESLGIEVYSYADAVEGL